MNAPVALLASDWRSTIKSLREQFPDADDQTLFDTADGECDAADVVAAFVRSALEDGAMAEAVENLEQDYRNRKNYLYERALRKRQAALRLLEDMGEKTLRRPEFTLSVSHRKGTPEVYDEEALPQSLFKYKTVRSVDREKLAEAVAAGDVPGVRVGNGSSVLSVRMK